MWIWFLGEGLIRRVNKTLNRISQSLKASIDLCDRIIIIIIIILYKQDWPGGDSSSSSSSPTGTSSSRLDFLLDFFDLEDSTSEDFLDFSLFPDGAIWLNDLGVRKETNSYYRI